MRGQRGWVLLLLAAVFTMHGLQCAAAESTAPPGAHGAIHAIAAAGPDPVVLMAAPGAAMASADRMTAPHLATAVTASTVAIPLGAHHDSVPRGAGHLYALCLAVLAAGLAVLLLALLRGSRAITPPLARRAAGRVWEWLGPPRPPDLYSLCLMRI